MATKETELTKFDNGENYESIHEGENVDEHTCLPLVTFKGNNNYNIYHEYILHNDMPLQYLNIL